jgi:hypothetical protein
MSISRKFNLDFSFRWQVCDREEVNATRTHPNAPRLDNGRVGDHADD